MSIYSINILSVGQATKGINENMEVLIISTASLLMDVVILVVKVLIH